MSEENAQGSVENTETVETLSEKLRKAEAKIVDMKKSTTQNDNEEDNVVENKSNSFDETTYMRLREEEKFFEANPDMLEYKEKVLAKVAK
jgi:hypothetical protein